jgi:hypothetical protein
VRTAFIVRAMNKPRAKHRLEIMEAVEQGRMLDGLMGKGWRSSDETESAMESARCHIPEGCHFLTRRREERNVTECKLFVPPVTSRGCRSANVS